MIMGPDLPVSNQTAGSDLEMFERQTDSKKIHRVQILGKLVNFFRVSELPWIALSANIYIFTCR